MKVTREVVNDLWPLYASDDVSPDSRALVDEFLAGDPEWARTLRVTDGDMTLPATPSLPPDHEMTVLAKVKQRLRGPMWLMRLALVFSCLAFGRIVSDTSWTVSPKNFIATAIVAATFWAAFFVVLYRGRKDILIGRR
jgi:hypothetical protein